MTRSNKKPKTRIPGRPNQPPQLNATLQIRRTARFTSTGTLVGGVGISPNDLSNLLSIVGAGGVLSSPIFQSSVRVHSVEVWAAPNLVSAISSSVMVSFIGAIAAVGPDVVFQDTVVGTARAAHIYAKPPKSAVVSMWRPAFDTTTLFNVTCGGAFVIDVTYSATTNQDIAGAGTFGIVPVGAPPGLVVTAGLDGQPKATSIFVPMGWIDNQII